jgi:hypothetical protein
MGALASHGGEDVRTAYFRATYSRAEDEPGQSPARLRQASATFVTAVVVIADMALTFATYNNYLTHAPPVCELLSG